MSRSKQLSRIMASAVAAASVIAATAIGASTANAASTVTFSAADEAALTSLALPGSPLAMPAGQTGPVARDYHGARIYSAFHPAPLPSGANNFQCRPKAGQDPVVLIPGTGTNAYSSWSALSESLTRRGYCTYTFNINGLPNSNAVSLTGDIAESARGLEAFVNLVLDRTGASKVDLVGWSQGAGPLPNYYLKFGNSQGKVDQFIGLVPSNHGTTALGLAKLVGDTSRPAGYSFNAVMSQHNAVAYPQQMVGSEFNKKLYSTPVTQPGVKYTVITTTYDRIVTPYHNAYLREPGVTNILLQNVCPTDHSGHMNFTYSPNVIQMVEKELSNRTIDNVYCQKVAFLG